MRLQPFFEQQARLDNKIVEVHNLQGINLTGDVTEALHVELAELANEVGYFKYWKINKKDDKERQFDEWADGFHFFLSLGNKYGHSDSLKRVDVSKLIPKAQDDLIKEEPIFHRLFDNIRKADFSQYDQYYFALCDFFLIGHLIGMSEDDMSASYMTKNQVNYERLNSGY